MDRKEAAELAQEEQTKEAAKSHWGEEYFKVPEAELKMNNNISLRDYFAAAALTGLVNAKLERLNNGSWSVHDFSETAYQIADAMLAERNGTK